MINEPSSTPRLTSLELRKHLDGGMIIGVVSKRTYRIQNGRCTLADEQAPLVEEPVLTEGGLLEHDSDRILQRRQVDVVIDGKARAQQRAGSFRAGLQIDGAQREIAVFGPRKLRLQPSGALTISDPEPITEVPLTWQNAYGGVDRTLLAELGDPLIQIAEALGEKLDPEQTMFAYPRNPHGRGYLIEASEAAVAATELPNLEDPAQPLTRETLLRQNPEHWPLAPRPVSTAWLPYVHFPRSAQTGLPVPLFAREDIELDKFPEVMQGLLRSEALAEGAPIQRRIDIGCAQSSAPTMRFADVNPGASIELRQFHPHQPIWRWHLPLDRPRVAYRLPMQSPVELAAKIRSLFIQPDKDLVSVVWVGEQTLQGPIAPEQLRRAEYGMKWTTTGPSA